MKFGRMLLAVQVCLLFVLVGANRLRAQTGTSGTIAGTVIDPSGAAVANATVTVHNPVSGYQSTATTGNSGSFTFPNVPFNPYHLTVTAPGFAAYSEEVELNSGVPLSLKIKLAVAGTSTTVTVESAGELLETDSTAHVDVSRQLFEKLPLESASSSLSSLVTEASPGVAADSNGLFHGMGDHAENSFSIDGQPVTDQQSKVFSNQLPVDAVQSMEVIEGAPPAQYGDKTSLVIDVTTRSGQGMTTPHGAVTFDYGTFGTSTEDFNVGFGGPQWGNFIAINGLRSGRFLDPPEFVVMHDKGNEENAFDRADYQFSTADSAHLDLGFTRSWFQTPNSFDAQNATAWNGVVVNDSGIGPNGRLVGPADQRSQIRTFNIAPTWTHLVGSDTVVTTGLWVRHDQYNYYPSGNPFADLGPPSLSRESVGQLRFLTSAGVRSSISYVKGIHNVKAGVDYEQTFLTEHDRLGIVDPTLNSPCLDVRGIPVQGFSNPGQCAAAGDQPNVASNPNAPSTAQYPLFNPDLLPYDLTRNGTLFRFLGHTDVKELALYLQDTITKGEWSFNFGIRGDLYNGITAARQAEPRLGIAYNIKPSNTILRISYARSLETPFNENLVLSSTGCSSPVLGPLLACTSSGLTAIAPGYRNEFHAGLQQAFGKYLVVDGEYIWKYTRNAYDFSVLGNTPITFPIEWHNSKIPGYTLRASVPNFHGLAAFVVMSSVAARFFTPQIGGAGEVPTAPLAVFRIDHDEIYNGTAHLQYQPWRNGPWLGFNWRYDSGLVAGASPCYGILDINTCPGSVLINGVPNISMIVANAGGVPMSADQEFQAGFTCNGIAATPTTPLPFNCPASEFASTLIKVPGINQENDDHNPPRIAARGLFDLSIGDDNLFHSDRYKWSARLTVINLANKFALYNFLSTFSGTHYVTPRTFTGEIGFHF